ncbi:N-methyl-L-tryptophan oxidase [Atlantibacter hermannii]|uniref:N-methyl-L-tryptophan oxidase n=1 Tax=Atlantibacter hermannii TaxID=565 RepID=UPI000EDA7DFA|nr:N-methyl-L-tryptophan oxidase [Atlantibacter hermannii]HAI50394.1 N-methyl-L-tryptophan oxidase [Enterobacteriaceae bacterium]MBW9432189.1 N-methyl-L-tryptophan oxidase [Atlantibacter hermannii]MDU7390904.1 N-methyl-L-tryptophan oxidase [Atlantibacter hermannii]WIF56826.1 N-methyl-L-tryptophan oxidase [Atlantibacter hermannii]HAP80450.1 N-methyl-L-tryptophan oxidase [Enterobacteriaceae bacterium]
MEYDLIIVGSGSVGAAAGYYATKAGLKVLMTDAAHPPHQEGSHHGESRLIRHAYGEGEKYVPLVLRAQALWDELQQISGEKIFTRSGVLNLGPADSAFLTNVARSAQQFNLPLEKLDAAALMARWPEITVPETFIGLFEPDSGVLHSETAIAAWIRLAEEAGCAQLFNCPVEAIHSDAQGVSIETSEGTFHGRKMLVSAGTWVKRLIPELPVTPVRKIFAWYQADGRYSTNNRFPAFTGELPNGDQFYGFPADNNELKIGKHNGGQVISTPAERKPFGAVHTDGAEAFPFLRHILPGIGGCLYGASCTYDNSPDEDFIIDTLPGASNTLVITGLSGHGFKFASVLGEIALEFAQDAAHRFDLTPFSLSRFSHA